MTESFLSIDRIGESFALLYGRPVIGIDLLRLVPDGQIGMSILKLFHLVLGILKTVKGILQGACLKQMATSQLKRKVPSQV